MMWKVFLTVLIALLVCLLLPKQTDWEADVKGQNVLVTGASSGIGEQIAYLYARMGANVFITARREDKLKEVIEECRRLGSDDALFGFYPGDMSQYKLTTPIVIQEAAKFFGGRIDHLILNHAKLEPLQKWEGTEKQLNSLEEMMSVNLMSYIHLVSHALPHLRKSTQARVGVVSSTLGKLESSFMSAYATAKFALDGFFSSLRKEFKTNKENISVTLHLLGFIDTDAVTSLFMASLNVEKSELSKIIRPPARANDTAFEVIKSTTLGERELYYQSGYLSRIILPYLPAVRYIFPQLVEVM